MWFLSECLNEKSVEVLNFERMSSCAMKEEKRKRAQEREQPVYNTAL